MFISYSRDDLDFADQLAAVLRLQDFETTLDREAISGGEDWKRRLGNLIREADTIVFVLSPASASSGMCAWEVDEAYRLGKRIIPVICRALEGASAPPRLQDLNYIFFYHEPKSPGSGFGIGQTQLVAALKTDFEWLREHTRLLLRATEWVTGGRPPNRLLSGNDITAAKAWLARRPKGAPEPTALHLEFIRASEEAEDARLSAQRKQLAEIAAAQEERAKALHEAEQALRRTIRLQRRQAWGVTVTVATLAAVGWWAYGTVKEQRAVAREAARTDVRGQIIAYAAAFGSMERDTVPGGSTSPYTTPIVQKLRQKKNVVDAIIDAHQQVLDLSQGEQRPLISTSMNGQVYLHQQPATRQKRVLAISVDDIGDPKYKLSAPPHDVDAVVKILVESGFDQREIAILRNPDRSEIEEAIVKIKESIRRRSLGEAARQSARPESLTRVGFYADPPDNTLALFFFAGHGAHIGDADYIIPKLLMTPAEFDHLDPDKIASLSVDVKWLTQELERTSAASILILDTHFPVLRRNAR